MEARGLKNEEIIGLMLAAMAHVGLVLALILVRPAPPPPPPDRISVTLSDQTGAVSTSPNPQADPLADKGPELGEPAPAPVPVPQPEAKPEPAPQPKASAAPTPKTPPKPSQQAQKPPSKWPFAPPAKAPPAKVNPPRKAGASILDDNYGKGLQGGSTKGKDLTPPAAVASAQQVSSWSSLIGSKVRGPWNGCPVSGLDVGKLRATVRFTLDPTGRIQSIDPFDVTGVTDANRPQVKPFKDCAVRAIRLAAPFSGLPPEFHDQWKNRRLNFRKE
ncbi:MAG: hypothetical protein ACKOPM_14210 [Novosphingobium sp.]